MFSPSVMGEPLSSRQLLHNSYHLSIHSSIQAIQTTLLAQTIMLQSQHTTITDIKSTVISQNTTLQDITKTLVETFSKISSYQPPSTPPMSLKAAATGSTTHSPTPTILQLPVFSNTIADALSPTEALPSIHYPHPLLTTQPPATYFLPPNTTAQPVPQQPNAQNHGLPQQLDPPDPSLTLQNSPNHTPAQPTLSSTSVRTRTDAAPQAISVAAPPSPKSPTSPLTLAVAALGQFSLSDLLALRNGSMIGTLVPSRDLLVVHERHDGVDVVNVDGVRIAVPSFFNAVDLIVHGLDGILELRRRKKNLDPRVEESGSTALDPNPPSNSPKISPVSQSDSFTTNAPRISPSNSQ